LLDGWATERTVENMEAEDGSQLKYV